MATHYVKEFNADMGELSLNLASKGDHWKRYSAGSISSIKSRVEKKKILFLNKSVELIEIRINGEDGPYIIRKGRIDDDYQWVKNVLKTFSEKYKVSYLEEA